MPAAPRIAFSHVGIHVRDPAKMEDFYTRVLGFVVSDRGALGEMGLVFLTRDPREHHQIVLASGRSGGDDARVVNQISLRAGSLGELRGLKERLEKEGARTLPGDHGNAWSVYAADPEGNALEFFVDTPWYVSQPRMQPLDLSLSDDEIAARTRERIAGDPSFRPVEEWRAELARRLGEG
jgi:catechol-2,3-dioxygenase